MLTGNDFTLSEWVTGPSRWTGTNWVVVHDLTFRVETTSAQTWVLALRVNAGSHRGTFSARHTLRTTLWRNAEIAR